jgi:LPS export ABC transporter protein LptC
LSAKYAIHYDAEHRWEAQNDVVVVNEKGEQLNTEKLIWDEQKEKLYSDQFVKITTPDEIIMGKGFEANQDFSRYKIFNVTGRITVKE